MKIPFYQVDAFASKVFSGNPAGVCLLDEWIDDVLLQAIADENNLSETAFLVRAGDGYEIRWFTPTVEVALCGHATLASAHVVFNHLAWPSDTVTFQTRRSGPLTVSRRPDLLVMDFPALPPHPCPMPPGLPEALGARVESIFDSEEDHLAVLETEDQVRNLKPDIAALGRVECRGVIVTAPGTQCDFVSRFFGPRCGIPEDPVTGSAHCVLVPYWTGRTGRRQFHARQVSRRGGELFCENLGDRVSIAGKAVTYLEGMIVV